MTVEERSVRRELPDGAATPGFKDLLGEFQSGLESELRAWLARKREGLTAEVAATGELVSKLDQYVLRGGKRLRPALLFYAYRACGGTSRDAVMPAALAVELLHTYLLIHDDIMDRAPTRRGEPTAHLLFSAEHRSRGWHGDADHHGESAAILLGDLAHCYAEELFSAALLGDPPLPVERASRLRGCFATMCQEVITGQYLEFTAVNRQLAEEDLLQILRMKSGRYSVERPIQLGALLADAPDALLEPLSEFGLLIGEAFQLHDDLLGIFGDSAAVGKPVGGDLVEGKYTLLVHHALTHAPASDAEELRTALGNAELEPAEIDRATGIIRRSGAQERVARMVESRHADAARILEGLPLEERGKLFLAGLVDYLRERTR